ncbi:MAG TPA: hypothetical protein VIK25_15590 [Gemmatimonadaceae bacterium]
MDEIYEQLPDGWDWRNQPAGDGITLGLIVMADQSLFEDDEGMGADALFEAVAKELKETTGAVAVTTSAIDPYVGAGGTALQVAMQFMGYAADVISIGTFLVGLRPGLQAAVRQLKRRLSTTHSNAHIVYSAAALQSLVMADLCESERIDPAAVHRVECLMHAGRPAEPCVWLRPTDAAYTITVTMPRDDGFYHLWSYLVTCHADVVSITHFPVPTANASHWTQVQDRLLRPLRGMA